MNPQQLFERLCNWSRQNYAHLPWRVERGLYQTLVSEMMLQQTTVGTVLRKYPEFMSTFPALQDLARATEEDVLIAWQGLGYYRRAKSLRLLCQYIQAQYAGKIPADYAMLLTLPGIGPYTASALLGIGLNRPALCIDVNLDRVLARFIGPSWSKELILKKGLSALTADGPSQQLRLLRKKLAEIEDALQVHGARIFNEALMDLGRVVCRAKNPRCQDCHLQKECYAFNHGAVDEIPQKKSKRALPGLKSAAKKEVHHVHLIRILLQRTPGTWTLIRKKEDQWLSGQLELPSFVYSASARSQLLDQQYPHYDQLQHYLGDKNKAALKVLIESCCDHALELGKEGSRGYQKTIGDMSGSLLGTFTSTITKYRFTNTVIELKASDLLLSQNFGDSELYQEIPVNQLSTYPIAGSVKKSLAFYHSIAGDGR